MIYVMSILNYKIFLSDIALLKHCTYTRFSGYLRQRLLKYFKRFKSRGFRTRQFKERIGRSILLKTRYK